MPQYRVELYGDVGFTADGSNILDFLTREARDAYFDNLPHTTHTGTSVNKDFLDTGSIKLEISNTDTIKYANASYMRVASSRFVQSAAEPSQEVTYLFIAAYEVVSSTENTTVIRYTVVNDNWMNYQFNVKLRPCSVERMHVDRWDSSDDSKIIMPCIDLIDGYFTSVENTDIYNGKNNGDYPDAGILVVIYTKNYNSTTDSIPYKVLCSPFYNNSTEPVHFKLNNVSGVQEGDFIGIQDAIDGSLAADLGIPPSSIISVYVQPYPSYAVRIVLPVTSPPNYEIDFGYVQPVRKIGKKYAYTFDFNGDIEFTSNLGKYFKLKKPNKPIDGAIANESYEPAMYRSPVRQYKIRYGHMQYTLPQNACDYVMRNQNSGYPLKTYCPITLDGTGSYIYIGEDLPTAISKGWAFELPVIDGNIINDQWLEYFYTSRGADRAMMWTNIATLGLSDLGSTYVSGSIGYRSNMTQARAREFEMDTVRAAMNSTTGNGFVMYGPQDRYNAAKLTELSNKADLATGMAKGSMTASAFGGITAAAANAIGSYSGQVNKESAIKNQPAQVTNVGGLMGLAQGKMIRGSLIEMKVDNVTEKRYFELFSKFGYYIGAVTQPNIRTRKFFNYLKTNGAIVTGNAPQTVLLNIASMFDAGTTIWHMDKCTKDTLYDYTYENIERTLIS